MQFYLLRNRVAILKQTFRHGCTVMNIRIVARCNSLNKQITSPYKHVKINTVSEEMFGSSTFSKQEALCNQKFGTAAMYFFLTRYLVRICFLLPHSVLAAPFEFFLLISFFTGFYSYVYFFCLILFESCLWYRRLIPFIPDSTALQRQTLCCSYHTRCNTTVMDIWLL